MDIRRSADREITRLNWLTSRASFSMATSWDPRFGHPRNTHHGVLTANNEDTVAAGWGFDPHRHRNLEVVTWVLSGSIVHADDKGNTALITPGVAQRMTAGTGILHSERNDAWKHFPDIAKHDDDAQVVQMWIAPDEANVAPAYAEFDANAALASGELVPVVSGLAHHRESTGIGLRCRYAGLHAARLGAAGAVHVPAAAYLHVFVTRGAVDLEGAGRLDSGDAARLTVGGQRITALTDAEVLIWEMTTALRDR